MESGRRSSTGMTLLELLMVVVIVAVLAAIAVPTYTRTVERGYWRQANDLLFTIYHGERSYFLTNAEYVDGLVACNGGTKCMGEWRKISMDDPNGAQNGPVRYSVTTDATKTKSFTATATRIGGSCNNRTQTIDQNRVATTGWPQSGTCP